MSMMSRRHLMLAATGAAALAAAPRFAFGGRERKTRYTTTPDAARFRRSVTMPFGETGADCVA